MEKLTNGEMIELQRLIYRVNHAKQFENAKEFYTSFGYPTKWEELSTEYQSIFITDYEDRIKDKVLVTSININLKGLKRKGYIEIIKDDTKEYDLVKVLQFF
jgi:hypothetical protein